MNPNPKQPAETTDELLGRLLGASESIPDRCPDANLLAALAGDRLLDEERRTIEPHLAACRACRMILVDLFEDLDRSAARRTEPVEAGIHRPPVRHSILPWSLAAAAALVLGLLLWNLWLGSAESAPLSDRTLVASATQLRRSHPDWFGDFQPLLHAERLSASSGLQRADAVIVSPAGTTGARRPNLRWTSAEPVARWQVELLTADGRSLWSLRTDRPKLDYPSAQPALAAGDDYFFVVRGQSPLGQVEARRLFTVASEESLRKLREGRAAIVSEAPAELQDLLEAQWAMRLGYYTDAVSILRGADEPDAPLVLESLLWVLDTIGSPEAERLRAQLEAAPRAR